jgi:putative ABC transport system substrate-binding protein
MLDLRRRQFITLIGGAAAWPLVARAQQPMPVIGYFSARSPVTDVPMLSAFQQGLNETGYVEGQNVAIEFRWAEGRSDRLLELAHDLVRRKVAVIVTTGGESTARAVKAATSTIPIVFISGIDPVESGLVASLSRPGGNLTGVSSFLLPLIPKQIGLLSELAPNAVLIGALIGPETFRIAKLEDAGRAVGRRLIILKASTDADIDAGTSQSNIVGPKINTIGCRPWWPN